MFTIVSIYWMYIFNGVTVLSDFTIISWGSKTVCKYNLVAHIYLTTTKYVFYASVQVNISWNVEKSRLKT